MCVEFREQPYVVTLKRFCTEDGSEVVYYSLLLGKVTHKRNGEHRSSHGFAWPIGRPIRDANAIVGLHDRALHFASSPKSAHRLHGYGSHRLAVLPAPKVWEPVRNGSKTPRCWHSSGGIVLFCADCDGIRLPVLDDPAFWHDLALPGSLPGGLSLLDLLDKKAV
jgi:hypothetical protein